MPAIRIALAQTNATVGDLEGNLRICLDRVETAAERGAALVVFPEMMASGYPIEDLATRDRKSVV
jgi:NAD+ synthase (glutamine-hydrolysing)